MSEFVFLLLFLGKVPNLLSASLASDHGSMADLEISLVVARVCSYSIFSVFAEVDNKQYCSACAFHLVLTSGLGDLEMFFDFASFWPYHTMKSCPLANSSLEITSL